jgi:hypothetical protein
MPHPGFAERWAVWGREEVRGNGSGERNFRGECQMGVDRETGVLDFRISGGVESAKKSGHSSLRFI